MKTLTAIAFALTMVIAVSAHGEAPEAGAETPTPVVAEAPMTPMELPALFDDGKVFTSKAACEACSDACHADLQACQANCAPLDFQCSTACSCTNYYCHEGCTQWCGPQDPPPWPCT